MHNWRNELAQKLIGLQAADSSVGQPGFEQVVENNPHLVTAWTVIALEQIVR